MARTFNGSDQWLYTTSLPVTAAPFTANVWFNPVDVTGTHVLWSIGNTSASNNAWLLLASGGDAGDPLQWVAQFGTAGVCEVPGYTANTWQMATAVEAASNDRRLYLDGGSEDTNTTNRSPSGHDEMRIGARSQSGSAVPIDGSIASVTVWNVALTAAEVASLYGAGGVVMPPWIVRPESIVCHYPLLDTDGDINFWGDGTYDLTLNNTPTYSADPPSQLWIPPTSILIPESAAGGDATVTPAAVSVASSTVSPTPRVDAHPAVVSTASSQQDPVTEVLPQLINEQLLKSNAIAPADFTVVAQLNAVDLSVAQQTPAPTATTSATVLSTLMSEQPPEPVIVATGGLTISANDQTPVSEIAVPTTELVVDAIEQSPTVNVGGDNTVNVSALTVAVSEQSPTPAVSLSSIVQVVTAADQAPSVSASGSATFNATVLTIGVGEQAPIPSASVISSTESLTSAAQSATPSATKTATVVVAAASDQTPTTVIALVSPTQVVAVSEQAPSFSTTGSATVAVGVVALGSSAQSPVPVVNKLPVTQSVSAVEQVPTIVPGKTVLPPAVLLPSTIAEPVPLVSQAPSVFNTAVDNPTAASVVSPTVQTQLVASSVASPLFGVTAQPSPIDLAVLGITPDEPTPPQLATATVVILPPLANQALTAEAQVKPIEADHRFSAPTLDRRIHLKE